MIVIIFLASKQYIYDLISNFVWILNFSFFEGLGKEKAGVRPDEGLADRDWPFRPQV